jgi:hypothetical protein
MTAIHRHTYFRMSHITGPRAVLVSLRFGPMPQAGPWVTIRAAREAAVEPLHDVDRYVTEVLAGLAAANERLGASVQIEEIEIVPDDYPGEGQVRHCAMKLAEHFIQEARQGDPIHQPRG